MKKTSKLSIIFALLFTLAILFTAVCSVCSSQNFFIKQADKYNIVETANLKNIDEFTEIADRIISSYKGNENNDFGTKKGEVALYREDLERIKTQGNITRTIDVVLYLAAAGTFILFVLTTKEDKKANYLRFGRTSIFACILFGVVTAILLNTLQFAPFIQSGRGIWQTLFTPDFINDFRAGTSRFFGFMMLIPLFVSYFISHLYRKSDNVNDNYLYQ